VKNVEKRCVTTALHKVLRTPSLCLKTFAKSGGRLLDSGGIARQASLYSMDGFDFFK
jgi:hypothetical protein